MAHIFNKFLPRNEKPAIRNREAKVAPLKWILFFQSRKMIIKVNIPELTNAPPIPPITI